MKQATRIKRGVRAASMAAALLLSTSLLAQNTASLSEASFLHPDRNLYPETYFHFLDGNLSKEGIDADLQALSDAGISGLYWYHGTGGKWGGAWPGMDRQIEILSPEWEDMVAYLGKKTDSLGLSLAPNLCLGWSMAGGPWIKPENAMRRLVWSRTDVPAGRSADSPLHKGQPSEEDWRDYKDIRVLAFPTPLGDTGEPLRPLVSVCEKESWKKLVEGTNERPVQLAVGSSLTTKFTLPAGSVIRTLSLPQIGSFSKEFCYTPGVHVRLTARMESGEERVLVDADLPMSNWQDRKQPSEMEFACEEVTEAKEFTFTLSNAHPATVKFVRFYSAARKNSWRGEAGWSLIAKEPFQQHTNQDPRCFVKLGDIIDISDRMGPDGQLDWTAPSGDFPEGKWTVLRIGHVNLGLKNHPAPPEATGWECNKLDARGIDLQFSHFAGALQDGAWGGSADGILLDSWECRTQTWTETLEEDFLRINDYPLPAHMPALMGYVIDSQDETSRFLIDWRRCLNRLYCDHFFGRIAELSHAKGMRMQCENAGGDVVTMDPLEYMKYADVPTCEFWYPRTEGYVGDLEFKPIIPTASAAHIYGKKRIAAEAFTSITNSWDEHWQMLRDVANFHMAQGVSHLIFHTYTHNPQIGYLKPGSSFGKNGTPFLRGQTWWKYMPYFTTCFARMGYMLESGRPVTDILWYLGDEVGHRPPGFSIEGFKYDYCNPDVLLNRLKVVDGKLVTPEGLSYQVLWIPENERMLPETIVKIGELLKAGAKVVANAPIAPATLNQEQTARFDDAAASIWGHARKGKIQRFGKGRLAVGMTLEEALKEFKIKPRFKDNGADLPWQERESEGDHWYFVAAPFEGSFKGTVCLCGKGKAEWWNPVDGSVKELKTRGLGRKKRVWLDLAEAEGGFIVFRGGASAAREKAFEKPNPKGRIVPEGWTVRFPEGWGAPAGPIALEELRPWKDLDLGEEGRAFSGTATYEAVFKVDEKLVGKELILNLGCVDMIADVKVNGKSAGVRWTAPFRLPIGEMVHAGDNHLTIDVTSTWFNRLTYDAARPEAEKKTWTTYYPAPGGPLRPSGLMGPVNIEY